MHIAQSAGFVLGLTMMISGNSPAQPDNKEYKSFLWKQCNEDAIIFHVEPERLTGRIPEELSLELIDGKARLIIAAQDCSDYWFDGDYIGPALEVYHGVLVQGKGDLREIAGAERTFPTMTWYLLFTGSSNSASRERWIRSGTPSERIVDLVLELPQPEGGGRLTINDNLEYSWQITRSQPNAVSIGVNHDFYASNSDGELVFNKIQCLGSLFGFASQGLLRVTGGTEPMKVIDTGTYRAFAHTFSPIWCRASIGGSPPNTNLR